MRALTRLTIAALLAVGPAAWGESIRADGPSADAPAEMQQFGRFVGVWKCTTYARQRDRSWKANDWENTWSWYWVLDGHAIQDVWDVSPDATTGWSTGTNVRIYDPQSGYWRVAWTTTLTRGFDFYNAREVDGDMVRRPLEHHVLEEVRETGAPRLLVLRADVIPDVDRHGRNGVVLVEDHVEPVLQLVVLGLDVG